MNAPEVNSFVNVVNELSKTNKDNVSARIAKRLSTSVPWPPTQIETHLQIKSYQRWLETYFPGRINRGGLGHLWSEAYKRCEIPQQIDMEEQIAAQAAEMIAPKKYSKAADMSGCHYTRHENNLIKQMYADGATDKEIGESLGRSEKAVSLQRLRLKLMRSTLKRWSKAEEMALAALVQKGVPHEKIATELGRSAYSISCKVRDLGLTGSNRPKPAPEPTPPPAPPVQPAPIKPSVDPKPMTKSLPWWRRIFG
jgi:hypothetical protein